LQRIHEEEEVEERLEEPGEEDHPGAPVDHGVPLDDEEAAQRRPPGSRQARACDELGHQTTSLRRYVIRAAAKASATHPSRYRRCIRSSHGRTSPRVRSRQSVTPCQSGVSQATTSSGAGSFEIGKNVPENRNIGRITKRKIATKVTSVLVCAAQAAIGVEK